MTDQLQEVDELDPDAAALDPSLAWYEQYKDMPYAKLAARMLELRTAASVAEQEKIQLDKEHDVIRLRVVPERFLKDEITSMNIPKVGRLGLAADAYCNVPADMKEALQEWLTENGYADLIKPTVNPSSLKSLVKTLEKDDLNAGEEVLFDPSQVADPDEKSPFEQICELVKYTPFMRASVTKK